MSGATTGRPLPAFDRNFLASSQRCSVIGGGSIGGKARTLAEVPRLLEAFQRRHHFEGLSVEVPRFTVIATSFFEDFLARHAREDLVAPGAADDRIALAFQRGELSPLILGDLRTLIAEMRTPLAIRSSSRLEDALEHPFAGVYETKMIANNRPDVADRFRKLTEAIKFVYASTYFGQARSYRQAIGSTDEDEGMAVIIQEVVGHRYHERFYPAISGVLRTCNVYPSGPGQPGDGVVNLALGLGKTIVDGGVTWTYSPAYPRHRPPYGSVTEMLRGTQTRFWAVNMGTVPHDPIAETEYLLEYSLDDAELDGTLRHVASTYVAESDRLVTGTGHDGPRVLTFAPLLELETLPLNALLRALGAWCRESMGSEVEVEFAVALDPRPGQLARFGFLQVRPMLVAADLIVVEEEELAGPDVVAASRTALGNGNLEGITDVVYVRPDRFEARHTPAIARQLEAINRALSGEGRVYILMGFGRWGTSDPWLGIPVRWPQVSGARAIVEATLPAMDVDPSQGSHFFHNLSSFGVLYLTVKHTGFPGIDWVWLDAQPAIAETELVRHVRVAEPLAVRVDGRSGRGVIRRPAVT